jgi:hypothetical protein
MSPLLKLRISFAVVNPFSGKMLASRWPNSAVELPPKLFTVPGMNRPPSGQVHSPCRNVVEKNG